MAGLRNPFGPEGPFARRRAAGESDSLERRLRRKFILTAMASVAVVLALIMVCVNVVNYRHICKTADARLSYVIAGGGAHAVEAADGGTAGDDASQGGVAERADNASEVGLAVAGSVADKKDDPGKGAADAGGKHFDGMTAESPFDTRYFTVSLNDGNVVDVDTTCIAAIDAERAERYATKLYKRGRTSGFVANYRFVATKDGEDTLYVFVDCTRELSNFHSFLDASIAISVIGLLAVLVLVWAFSGAAIKPMVESYQKQKRFITDASHEIKTPLAVIDAANEVQEIESGESEWTQSIHEQVARLTSLTERLVFLARMDEGAAAFTMSSVDLSAVVAEAAEPFESVAVSRGKHLSLDIAEGVHARADAAAIAQVVELLLDNATRYASDGSVIELTLRAAGRGHAKLTTTNAVDALPEGDLDRLFDRFYRADTSRNSKTGGSGVGLSVVRAIAEAHGGTATATGKDGQITFTIRI